MESDNAYMIKGEKIGSGTYGIVYKMLNSDGTESYAFKRNIKLEEGNKFSTVIRELDILNRVKDNPRIISILMVTMGNPCNQILSPVRDQGNKLKDDDLHFLFELGDSDLYDWMCKNMTSFSQIKQFMIDILLGMEFIHQSGILHRDIKTQNIIVFKPEPDELMENNTYYRAKICDFGLSIPYSPTNLSKQVTTLYYRAPEVAANKSDYNAKIDMWSVGCIFYELIFRIHFVSDISDSVVELKEEIIKNSHYRLSKHELHSVMKYYGSLEQGKFTSIYQKIISNFSLVKIIKDYNVNYKKVAKQLEDIMNKLLSVDPDNRGSATEILNMPFFDSNREYIEKHREIHKPSMFLEYRYDIQDCLERKHVIENIIVPIYNKNRKRSTRSPWYSHQRLFHAIDLFDRCLRYSLRRASADSIETKFKGKVWDSKDSELYFYNCLFIAIKYFSVLEPLVDIQDIIPSKYDSTKIISELARRELHILRNILDYSIYRYTLFEAISVATTNRSSEFEFIINIAITKLFNNDINGITPTKLAELVISQRNEEIRSGVKND